jgi:hypothetical protein
MSSYISSNANRFYTALESAYGQVGTITAANRIPAIQLTVAQQLDVAQRRDKTGSRTFTGNPPGARRKTSWGLQTYMTGWDKQTAAPGYGPLFQGALGAAPLSFAGGTVASSTVAGRLIFQAAHGLTVGQGVCCGGEIRFVDAIINSTTVQLNVPFTALPASGAAVDKTLTYSPATEVPSISIFDYWSPATAVQRLLCGAAVDKMEVLINQDFHEFRFNGLSQDVLDTSSFSGEAGEMQSFPVEPALSGYDYSIVPGSMGQAWLGSTPSEFMTVTSASITVNNNLDLRVREFGSNLPRAIWPGKREVNAVFELFSQDDQQTQALYQAARQQSPITVMFQLGEVEGQVMGVYLKSVIPEVPEFDDGDNRLQWRFRPSRAQGTMDDEIAVAFA